jgi:hypothetical protein
MESLQECINEYRIQVKKGAIQKAYKGLMDYIMGLRTHFNHKFPDYSVSGSVYIGYMDMTYFSIVPKPFKERGLKIAIVFLHEAFRFEVWLSGYNKQVQTKYWKYFKENGWDKYHLVPSTKGADSILEFVLVDNPDFGDVEPLTKKIEGGTLRFINDVESFLT